MKMLLTYVAVQVLLGIMVHDGSVNISTFIKTFSQYNNIIYYSAHSDLGIYYYNAQVS